VVGFSPSTITICLSDGSFVCGIPQRCDSGLYRAQLDIELPARDKAPSVRAFLAHIHGKEWGRCLQTDLVCFRGQSQLDLTDPATVLVGGTIDIMSVQEARESACSIWLDAVGGTGSSNTCGAGRTQAQKDADAIVKQNQEHSQDAGGHIQDAVQLRGRQQQQQQETQVSGSQENPQVQRKQADQQVQVDVDQQGQGDVDQQEQADQQAQQKQQRTYSEALSHAQQGQSSGGSQMGLLTDSRIKVCKKSGSEWIMPVPLEKGVSGVWKSGPDKAERLRRIDQLDRFVKEVVRTQDRSIDFRDKIGQLMPEVRSFPGDVQTCSACLTKKGQFSPDDGFSKQMWSREEQQRRFCRKCMKHLWCYACGKIHRPGEFSYTQIEFKLNRNRRCKECVDGGIAVKQWKTDDSTDHHDLLLEGGKPVEIQLEKIKKKEAENLASKNCYYAALREDEQESDGGSSDEHQDDSSGDESDNDEEEEEEEEVDANGGGDSSSEENDIDFNRDFNNSTLEPGPSQRELQHAEELARAATKREEEKAESVRVKASWGLLQGERIRVLDYKGGQEVWAKSAGADGSLTQVELQDGQFAVVAKDWSGDGQVEIAQCITWAGDASGYLECANESDEAPCGWHVAPDAVGLLPYAGQKGYVAAWDGDEAVGVVANYKPGFDDEIIMGHLEAFREVRVLDTQQSGVYPRGDPRNGWVLVVDAHPSESVEEFVSERDVWWPNCLDTAMVSGERFNSSDDNIVVELGEIDSGSKSTRRGVWVLIEDYWPYPANSPLQDVLAEGCNNDSESDSESNSSGEGDLKTLD